MPESFNDYFSSVFTKENDSSLPELPEGHPSIDAVNISTEGVILLLKGLDSFKACGPVYNIPTRFSYKGNSY